MKKQYLIISAIFIVCALLISKFANGQTKEVILPNFESPFLKKESSNAQNNKIIKPVGEYSPKSNSGNNYYSVDKEGNNTFIHFTDKNKIAAKDFFVQFSKYFSLSKSDSFALYSQENDNIGFTHYRYQQFYKGIIVTGGEYLLHEKKNILVSANGNIYNNLSIDIIPKISKDEAIQFAIENVGAEIYQWENKSSEDFLKQETNDSNATNKPKAVLVISPINGIYTNENFRLCYKINIASEKPYDIVDVFIDAHTGKIVNKISKIAFTEVTGTANTLYSGTKTIKMDSYGGSYRLRESTRPIQTFNMLNGTDYSKAVDFTNSSTTWNTQDIILNGIVVNTVNNNWEDGFEYAILGGKPDIYIVLRDASMNLIYFSYPPIYNTFPSVSFNLKGLVLSSGTYELSIWDDDGGSGNDDLLGKFTFSATAGNFNFSSNGTSGIVYKSARNNPALDAHWGMEKVYDYYKTQHNRNSYNNLDSPIKVFVHYDLGLVNAFWNGQNKRMVFGDGDGITEGPQAALDVCGHEFTHGVIQYTANLIYQRESGALNESFADILGTAIEFYGSPSTANWLFSENTFITSGGFSRSMSNPKLKYQPNTYGYGTYWENPDCGTPNPDLNDNCGVHTNSGVQNFWFYLLSQGGNGTNDLNNSYSVTGIGITQATKIAYYNLAYYLTSNATYTQSYYGSLWAAEYLYGNPSTQYSAVRAAWYAVGIGSDPTSQCKGITKLTTTSGSFTDGSGSAKYQNNLNCSWLIEPTGADSISLSFSSFRTQSNYDTVFVYDGPTTASTLRMTWWGNTLPPNIRSKSGAMLVRFSSDNAITDSGWSASYISYGTAYCDGKTLLTSPSGSFTDGSGSNNYGNNSLCYWLIAPPCATSVTLSFSSFNTELNYDGIIVFDGNNTNATVLLNTSGTSIPSNITSSGGEMLVIFISDYSTKYQGFAANYTSTGSAYCSGTTTFNTYDYGTITDGSGNNKYCNNLDCRWLIQPPQATTITLSFTSFKTETPSTDGNSIYDAVEVYDGINTSAKLLGRFSGSNLPPSVTSTAGSMYIRFYTDFSNTDSGWSANYTSTTNNKCSGTTNLTADAGSFSDGSGSDNYGNNANCKWLIQPPGALSISLNFTNFNTELNYDGIIVYDGADTSSKKLGIYTGTTLPPNLTSTGGSMLVWFISDQSLRKPGWDANYTSIAGCGSITKPNPITNFAINNANQCLTGNSFILTDNSTITSGTISRLWYFGDATTATNNPTNKTYSSANTYSLKLVTTNNYGCKDSMTKTVKVFSNPPKPTITISGNTLYSSASSGNQWFRNSILISGAVSSSYTLTQSGSYTTRVTNSDNCESLSDPFTYNSINETESTKFIIYPNPNDGKFKIESNVATIVNLEIHDILGKQVLKTYHIAKGETLLDVSELGKGIYMIIFREGSIYQIEKIVIK